MTHLVVGGTGLVGSALVTHLLSEGEQIQYTTRRQPLALGHLEVPFRPEVIKYDLLTDDPNIALPKCSGDLKIEFVYLVAAMPGFAVCGSNPLAWRVNGDAQIAPARKYWGNTTIVFVSSEAVEIAGGTAYARQKAAVEAFMHVCGGAIVRPSRVEKSKADAFAAFLVSVAKQKKPGVYRWA